MSRRPATIDVGELEKLAAMHCTQEEVAAWFDVAKSTICTRLQRDPWKTAWERGWAKGNISLRRKQKEAADNGDRTMLVWLGKQWLGQADVARTEHTGAGGGPIEVADARKKLETLVAEVLAEAERAKQG